MRPTASAVLSVVLFVALANADAGPGNEEPGQELEIDETYQSHVASIMSAIQESEGMSNVKYTDLKPQQVNIHTIMPRIPAVKVGMNALGHKMLHVHSDEPTLGEWSAEVLSSGASAGFSLTDRRKGLQKSDGQAGSQYNMYSASKILRFQDEVAGDIVQIQDGQMTLTGNKGEIAKKPKLTIQGGLDSVPRVTLVSKKGEDEKHISLYNKHGKFGLFAGLTDDTSIFHVAGDGSELGLTSVTATPKILIESTNKAKSQQEFILKGKSNAMKFSHQEAGTSSRMSFCNLEATGTKSKCTKFLEATTNGERFQVSSATDRVEMIVGHKIRGGTAKLRLESHDQVGRIWRTILENKEGAFHLKIAEPVGGVKKTAFMVGHTEANVNVNLNINENVKFLKAASFAHNVDVAGVVTMQGRNVGLLFSDMDSTKRENMELRSRIEDMEDDTKELKTSMVEMTQTNMAMREKMESMMSSLQLMQQTMTQA